MAERVLATPEELRQLLRYDKDSGLLFWLERPVSFFADGVRWTAKQNCAKWNTRNAGAETFTIKRPNGYISGQVFKRKIYAHRAIWALVNGYWPEDDIDHIDGNRANNRIDNLRAVSHQSNMRNMKLRKGNISGALGVSWDNRRNRWYAQIRVGGRHIHIGYFQSVEDAITARKAAEIKHGFHPNHGTVR